MFYFCVHCNKEVSAILGTFPHPDLGRMHGRVCPKCLKPVMVKDHNKKVLA